MSVGLLLTEYEKVESNAEPSFKNLTTGRPWGRPWPTPRFVYTLFTVLFTAARPKPPPFFTSLCWYYRTLYYSERLEQATGCWPSWWDLLENRNYQIHIFLSQHVRLCSPALSVYVLNSEVLIERSGLRSISDELDFTVHSEFEACTCRCKCIT